jgi:hypothetical protein
MQNLHFWFGLCKSLHGRFVCLHPRSTNQDLGPRNSHKQQCIGGVPCGDGFVAGTFEQGAQIRQQIVGGIDADDARFRRFECLFLKLLALGKRLYGFRFRRMHGENSQQVGDLKYLQKEGRDLQSLRSPPLARSVPNWRTSAPSPTLSMNVTSPRCKTTFLVSTVCFSSSCCSEVISAPTTMRPWQRITTTSSNF